MVCDFLFPCKAIAQNKEIKTGAMRNIVLNTVIFFFAKIIFLSDLLQVR